MVEECMVCHEPTGKAGRDDDSLYTPNGVGPWCEQCFDDAWPVMVPDAPDPALLALDRELSIRNLIAEREFNTATANRELAQFGEWRWDHDAADKAIADAIAALLAPAGAASEGVES